MAGKPHAIIAEDSKYHGYLKNNAWTLCLGAGVSLGIAPNWRDLAHQVVNEAFSIRLKDSEFDAIVDKSGWSLDSWIQASANAFNAKGKSLDNFKALLESILYSKIRDKAKGMGLDDVLTQVLNRPKSAAKDQVIKICEFFNSEFKETSLLQIAHFLIHAGLRDKRPRSVLTFNADTLLETYIDIKLRHDHYKGPPPHGHPDYLFTQVTRPSSGHGRKIPIIHCHGSLAPKAPSLARVHDSRDRLIFLEQEYLSMAASRAAWAQVHRFKPKETLDP